MSSVPNKPKSEAEMASEMTKIPQWVVDLGMAEAWLTWDDHQRQAAAMWAPWYANVDPQRKRDWDEMIAHLHACEISARDGGDYLFFHGTSLKAGHGILSDGPKGYCNSIRPDEPGCIRDTHRGLYFGTLASGVVMAKKKGYGEQGVILAVRASSLEAQGRLFVDTNLIDCGSYRGNVPIWPDREDEFWPFPDPNGMDLQVWIDQAMEIAKTMTWQDSLEALGAVSCAISGKIDGLVMLDSRDPEWRQKIDSIVEARGAELEIF